MKRIALVLALFTLVSVGAFANHPNKLGVGIVAGGNYDGANGVGGDIGLSLKAPSMPIYWGLYLNFNQNYFGMRATGDKYFIDERLFTEGSFKLDWFLGVGGYASLGFGSSSIGAALGARVPIGLSYHITPEFELWLAIAPSLGVVISPLSFPDWGVPGELGFRIWLK